MLYKLVCNLYKFDNYTKKVGIGEKEPRPNAQSCGLLSIAEFNHVSHQSGHDSLSSIAVDMVMDKPQ